MAYINGNKPIVTDGLVYALDFGNQKTYISGSSYAYPLNFRLVETSSVFQPFTLDNGSLQYEPPTPINTYYRYISTTGSIFNFNTNTEFTLIFTVKAEANGSLLLDNTNDQNLAINLTTSSLELGYYNSNTETYYTRIYPFTSNTSFHHITCRYSKGTFDLYLNSLPLTASNQGIVVETQQTSSYSTQTLFNNNNDTLIIGAPIDSIVSATSNTYRAQSFFGALSQMYIYNRALMYDEIFENYNIVRPRYGMPATIKSNSDKDATLYLERSNITDPVTTNAVRSFVEGLKTNNLWDKLFSIYPFINSATNLKEPTLNTPTFVETWTSSSQGLTPAAGTAYGILPTLNYPTLTTSSLHLSYLSYNSSTGQETSLIGVQKPLRGYGGNIYYSGSKTYHVYTTNTTSSFTSVDPTLTSVDVLVVAGGGAGGSNRGGGGGAGGLILSSSYTITPGTSYTVVVGEGGQYKPNTSGPTINGTDSIFGSLTAIGGGGGGYGIDRGTDQPGANGGSGGGGGSERFESFITNLSGGLAIPGQGFNGGMGSFPYLGGGGGGSSQSGSDATDPTTPGYGGSGSYFPQYAGLDFGSPAGWFAGGAGASGKPSGPGGAGTPSSITGVRNTGGGGAASTNIGGSGGSGIVIVSYDTNPVYYTGSTTLIQTETGLSGSIGNKLQGGLDSTGTIGFATISRTGDNTLTLHKNNISSSLNITVSGSIGGNLYLNAVNTDGTASQFAPYKISYASIGAGLTDSEVSTYYNLVSQFQTNLKRQNTLLDNYSGAAAAYSLRRIGPSGYFGPAIRVRRDSDNALRDIGFTSDGQLDTVGLLDFVGVTGSGFVQTWYDQSGNGNNAIQATAGNQPQVVVSGSIITFNGKTTLDFLKIEGKILSTLTNVNIPSPTTVFITAQKASRSGAYYFDGKTDNNRFGILVFPGQYQYFTTNNVGGANVPFIPGPVPVGNPSLVTLVKNGASSQLYENTILQGTTTLTTDNFVGLTIGARFSGGSPADKYQELIIYPSNQSSNRTSIESNINSNYKIFGSATASFDPDYQAFITATGITEPTQSAALETLVSDLKSYGLWNKMKAIYPMVTDRNNRFAQSENFDLTWNAVSASVSPNQTTAPNGTTTADLILDIPSVTNEHYIYQTIDGATGIVTGSEYVISAYAKFYNTPYIAFKTNTGAQAWFDVQTGVTGSYTGSNATITNVGNGWYRCALYFTSSGVTGPYNQHIHLARTDNDLTFTGTGTSGSYLWGAQFENGNLLGPYRKTEGSGFAVSGSNSMLDQMKFNLVNPVDTDAGFRITFGGNIRTGYDGIRGDNLSSPTTYINTFFNPSIQFTNTSSIHGSIYQTTQLTKSSPYSNIGFGINTDLFGRVLGFDPYSAGTGGVSTATYGTNKAYHIASRTSYNSNFVARNSIVKGNLTGSQSVDNKYILLGSINNASSPTGIKPLFGDGNTIALATIGDGLTDYEAKALYWIVQKYQTTLGRQVY